MEIEKIIELVGKDFEKLRTEIQKEVTPPAVDDYLKQYDPDTHQIITDKVGRPDREIKIDETGGHKTVKVTRLPIPMQQRIVSSAVNFLLLKPVQLSCAPANKVEEDLLGVMQKTWDDNKLRYLNKEIFRTTQVATECAEIWYGETAGPDYWEGTANKGKTSKYRVKVLSFENGDRLYPVFDRSGDMVAFGRAYKTREEGRDIDHFDVHLDTDDYYGTKGDLGWNVESEVNPVGKIRVIHHPGKCPWKPVQRLIEHLELSFSTHGDTNLYNASPMLKAKGTINSFSQKGEAGAIIEMDKDADLEYIAWVQAIESVKHEQTNLRNAILEGTDTIDMSPEQIKNLGPVSGTALELRFLPQHLRCAENEEVFGKGLQRRLNFLKAAMATINSGLKSALPMVIEPKFEYYMPKNDVELMELLTSATTAGIISKKTAIKLNPLVTDPDQEEAELQREQDAAQQQGLNNEMNNA